MNLGDHVEPGCLLGEISQDDLSDTIREAESKLRDLRNEDFALTNFELHEKQTHDEAMARVKRATDLDQKNAADKLEIANRLSEGADRLRQNFNMSYQELLTAREKMYEIRDVLNKGKTRLAELLLEGTKAENSRRKAQLDRRLKINEQKRKLADARKKMMRTSQLVSREYGRIAQVLSAPGELVHEGAPVVLLHSPKDGRGTDDEEAPYDSIIFVPAAEGKKIEVGHKVEVSPTTIKREEHGFIRGKVVGVSELPATKLAMASALQHPELVDSFLKRYAPGVLLRVHVKLDEAPPADLARAIEQGASGTNHFLWSSSSGLSRPLKTGTMCQAAIVVDRPSLITLVLPWTKRITGLN
jgi:HlyD family secretion protein